MPATLAACPALPCCQHQLSDVPGSARSRTRVTRHPGCHQPRQKHFLPSAKLGKSLTEGMAGYQESPARMGKDAECRCPSTGLALVPKPHLISADLTPEEKHRVLSRSQFPRKYFSPSHKIPTFHLPPCPVFFRLSTAQALQNTELPCPKWANRLLAKGKQGEQLCWNGAQRSKTSVVKGFRITETRYSSRRITRISSCGWLKTHC